MKKIVLFLLALCLLVSLLPAAAQADGVAGGQDYGALYVSDGLVLNFLSSVGVDLSAGTWTSLDGEKQVKLLGGSVWRINEDGALTYALADNDMNVGIDLGIENLPAGSFTVEAVARGIGYTQNADGTTPALTTAMYGKQTGPSFVYGPLKGEGFPMERDPDPTHYDGESNYKYGNDYAYNNVRWYYSEGKLGWQQTNNQYHYFGFAWENGWKHTGKTVSYVITHTRAASSSQYSVAFDGAKLVSFSVPMTGKSFPLIEKADDQEFVMFRSFPAEIFAIRVYDRALTAAEIDRNHFADVAAHFRLDISAFAAMSEAQKKNVYSMFRTVSLDDDPSNAEAVMKAALAGSGAFDVADSLYVSNGLRAMFLSFDAVKDSMLFTNSTSLWIDVVNGNVGELRGKKWVKGEHGGVSYTATYDEWKADHNFGLYFDINLLPDGEFTVESVINPVGITNEDGTRYVDNVNVYGTYVDNVFAFGPLKAMSFVCPYKNDPNRLFEHRWVYVASGCWNAAGMKALLSETGFTNSDGVRAIQFDVLHEYEEKGAPADATSRYYFYSDYQSTGTLDRSGLVIQKNETDGIFCIEGSMPGEIYAVRIYDRRLTASEMMQNHVADLVYYYDLDPTLFLRVLQIAKDPRSVLELFAGMNFDLSREEAAATFNDLLCGLCIRADGIAARLDGKVGLRAEFTLDLEMIRALEAQGYDVGVAARILIGEDETVIPVYENGAKKDAFFLDADTFAAAVHFRKPDTAMMMRDVRFAYTVTLREPGGEPVLLSGNVKTEEDLSGAFEVYAYLANGKYAKNAFVCRTVDACYDSRELTVGAGGAFPTVAEAMAEALRLLGESASPFSVRICLADGVHRVAEPIAVDGGSFRNPYSRLMLTGGSADAVTVTGTAAIRGADFAPVAGTDYFVYRFTPDGEGKYPAFRAFFVNGNLATLAHSGELRYDSGLQHTMPCELGFSADGTTAGNKFYLHEELLPDPDHAAGAELHVQTQWDFNIIHVTRVDVSDRTKDDAGKDCVAVYFDETERASFDIPGGYKLKGREYWLENAKSFVDEPGEYYYDEKTGELFYYPESGMDLASAALEYAVTDQLFVCDDVCRFTVSGITFTGTDDLFLSRYGHTGGQAGSDNRTRAYYDASGSFPERAVFLFRGKTSYLTVKDCVFRELSCEGITMRGRVEHVTVDGCRFFNVGATAIRMAEGSAAWNDKCGLLDVTVTNNYIDNTGWSIRQCCATQFGSAKDFTMEYNTILHSSYTAISIGWHWGTYNGGVNLQNVSIGSNYIASFMTDMKDGGAIYTLGANAPDSDDSYFNFTYQNYIVFTKDTGCRGMVVGIYHDGSSSNWYDSDNVIVAASSVNDRKAASEYYYYYSQTIDGQVSHNNAAVDNYFVNLRAEDEEDRLKEAFRSTLNREYRDRNITVEPNDLFFGLEEFWESAAPYYAENAGSEFRMPDVSEIANDDY